MGAEGRRRIEESLGWPHQAAAYRGVYQSLLGIPESPRRAPSAPDLAIGAVGRPLRRHPGSRRVELRRIHHLVRPDRP